MGPHDIQTWTQQIDVLKAFLNKDILRFDLLGYKKEKESEWLYRINGCAHNRTTDPIWTIENTEKKLALSKKKSILFGNYLR